MRNAGLEEAQAGIKIAGRNINNLRYADDTTLMAEREEELKILLMKVKEESVGPGSGTIRTAREWPYQSAGHPVHHDALWQIHGVTRAFRLERISSFQLFAAA